ncbi:MULTISPECIES: DNA (cytosine-5-)-methyltransferase [unclassified Microbulbifer]|uniref:DNA cytosine methyltransferase n=1 Tax=unclassified Microbulbifer TaxID=2619833 RepID=UPI0027E3F7B0|nr:MULTISPECIES: DNA (cytosine-5-)-methyltransferase [unclassified Microbulbifer]
MNKDIAVIDLFAGPGGLGEGFSSLKVENYHPFEIKISVEKEESAHKTLTLRSFYRKFSGKGVPKEYYEYLRDERLGTSHLSNSYPEEWESARKETLYGPKELGNAEHDRIVFGRLKEIKRAHDGPFVVIGGPPCQAYSVMGRVKNSSLKGYIAEDDRRNFLYKEYLKVLAEVQPEVFVMENVRGLVTAKVHGEPIFPKILKDLECPGAALELTQGTTTKQHYYIYSLVKEPDNKLASDNYPNYQDLNDYVIKAEDYGVPQSRHRVILLGVRKDLALKKTPRTLVPGRKVHVKDVIGDLPNVRSGVSKEEDSPESWKKIVQEVGFDLAGKLFSSGRSELAEKVLSVANNLTVPRKKRGHKRFLKYNLNSSLENEKLANFYLDSSLGGILNHYARGHMRSDLQRYMFCASYAELNRRDRNPSPTKSEFPGFLAPKHKSWDSGKFSDRFRVQIKNRYATTITSHIGRDGHYFIHYDPKQCRSLTVREAARIQTFPDNYCFEGNQTQQYVQVGNAVPPYLARQIAGIVFQLIQ